MRYTSEPVRQRGFNPMLAKLQRRLSEGLQRWREQQELAALIPTERERILAELGVPHLGHLPADAAQAAELLPAMLRGLGLPAMADDVQHVRRDLERVCSNCPVKTHCRRAIASGNAGSYRQFCPNAATLEALQQQAAPQVVQAG